MKSTKPTSTYALKYLQSRFGSNQARDVSRRLHHTGTGPMHRLFAQTNPWWKTSVPPCRISTTSLLSKQGTFGLNKDDEIMMGKLIEYKDRHGDCHVPSGAGKFGKKERQRLGVSQDLATWVSSQRTIYRNAQGKKGKLDNNYVQVKLLALESLGFIFSDREAQWQRNFNRLEKYATENDGDMNVDESQDPQLKRWVDKQRKEYQNGNLSQERTALLEDLNFVFDVHDAKWWDFHSKLVAYQDLNGDTLVPADYPADPPLGNWVARQRRRYSANELQKDRIKALEDIGFSWEVLNDNWDKYYAQLCEFYVEHGHTRVPRSDRFLWSWVDRQRRQIRQHGNASSGDSSNLMNRIDALNKVGFDWMEENDAAVDQVTKDRAKKLMELPFKAAVHEELWIRNFKELCAFRDRYGHFSVPYSGKYSDLSNWVRHQRYLFKRNKLPKERYAVLNDIDFAWTAQAARWDRLYEELMRFYGEHGHTRVPSRKSELYRWINQQRKTLNAQCENLDSSTEIPNNPAKVATLEKILFE